MKPKTIFICAGELSGDKLAAGLILAAKKLDPTLNFIGIAGPEMIAAGCEPIYPIDVLSVMGIFEVIPKLPKILSLRKKLLQNLRNNPPDLYIGIDAPDFNLPIEAKLKAHGIKTLHYVSPTVWAWRSNRVKQIKKAVDCLLCVFPFETDFLKKHDIPAKYIGHRGADQLPRLYTQEAARNALALAADAQVITLLPGSRFGEIKRMAEVFFQTAHWCWQKNSQLKFIVAAANKTLAAQMQNLLNEANYPFKIDIVLDKTYLAIKAANVVLATSGTVTLETFLLNKPMVVAYKMNVFSWALVNLLVKVKYCALPNLLADKALVPEFLQNAATPENLGQALMTWLNDKQAVSYLEQDYQALLSQLQCGADVRAALAVIELLNQ